MGIKRKQVYSLFQSEEERSYSRNCKVTEGKAPYNYAMLNLSFRYQSRYTLRLKLILLVADMSPYHLQGSRISHDDQIFQGYM